MTTHHNRSNLSSWTCEIDIVEDPLVLLGKDKTTWSDPGQPKSFDFNVNLLSNNVHVTLEMFPLLMRPNPHGMFHTAGMPVLQSDQ
jgi:hypothetical protein